MNREYSYAGWRRFLFLWAPYSVLAACIVAPLIVPTGDAPRWFVSSVMLACAVIYEYALLRAVPTAIRVSDTGVELVRLFTYRAIEKHDVVDVHRGRSAVWGTYAKVSYAAEKSRCFLYLLGGMPGTDDLLEELAVLAERRASLPCESASWPRAALLWERSALAYVCLLGIAFLVLGTVSVSSSVGGLAGCAAGGAIVLYTYGIASRTVVAVAFRGEGVELTLVSGQTLHVSQESVLSVTVDDTWRRYVFREPLGYTVELSTGRRLRIDTRFVDLAAILRQLDPRLQNDAGDRL